MRNQAVNLHKAYSKAIDSSRGGKMQVSVLFAPGDGQVPLRVAGRNRELDVLLSMHTLLKMGRPPPHNAALHAPRGLGKSVLLRTVKGMAEQDGSVDCLLTSAKAIESRGDLFEFVLGRQPEHQDVTRQGAAALDAGIGKIEGGTQRTDRYGAMRQNAWVAALTERCARKPVLLMVDEAHTIDLDVAQVLLNGSQMVRGEGAPFALMLAGTPGLRNHLAKAQSTFWSRLARGNLHLELLNEDEAADALRTPLQDGKNGLPFDEEAILSMAQQSDGYPYFIQIWGEQVELHSRRHGNQRITTATVDAVAPEARRMRNDLYRERWRELKKVGLSDALSRLAPHFHSHGVEMDERQAEAIMDPDGTSDIHLIEAAIQLGVLQEGEKMDAVKAGVPSFMSFVEQAERPAD